MRDETPLEDIEIAFVTQALSDLEETACNHAEAIHALQQSLLHTINHLNNEGIYVVPEEKEEKFFTRRLRLVQGTENRNSQKNRK